jgi:hypothetical protein
MAAAVLAVALSSCAGAPAPQALPEDDSSAGWLADVRLAVESLPQLHNDLYALVPKAEWESRSVEYLSWAAEPGRSREELLVGLMRLVASVGDGHTLVRIGPEYYLPFSFYRFEEGYVALAVPSGSPELLGARLASINGHPVAEVEAALAAVIARDNSMALANQFPNYVIIPFVLEGLGLAAHGASSFDFGFVLADGTERSVSVAPVRYEALREAVTQAGSAPTPLSSLVPGRAAYGFARVPGTDVLYLAYNSCREDMALPLKAFAADLAAELDSGGYRAVLVDLRRNGGGSSPLFWPVEKVLAERSAAGRGPGGLSVYVAIGRRTFSSAVLNAMELRSGQAWAGVPAAGAVFVGEPSGGRPNHYGEVKTLPLPSLQATLCYSTKHFVMWKGNDDDAIYPDLPTPLRYVDYEGGRDVVLEAVLDSLAARTD